MPRTTIPQASRNRLPGWPRSAALAFCVLASVAGSAGAQSLQYNAFSTSGSGTQVGCGSAGNWSPAPVSVADCTRSGGCVGGPNVYSWSDASSNDARLFARTRQFLDSWYNSCGAGWYSNAIAGWSIPVIFSGPPGAVTVPAPQIVVPFRATFNNIISGTYASMGASFSTEIQAGFSSIQRGGFQMGNHPVNGPYTTLGGLWDGGIYGPPTSVSFNVTGPRSFEATGHHYGGFNGPVTLGIPISIAVFARVTMHNGDYCCGNGWQSPVAEMSIEFGSAPVFVLPPGYTADSTDGRIINNQWVDPRPVITQQPVDAFICPGGATSFTIVATSQSTMSYQWRKAGTPLVDGGAISGTATPTLTITGAQIADQDGYDCIVSNVYGGTTSVAANLTICSADFNCSGSVGVQDLFDYLAAYFADDMRADFNESGAITVQDFFDFLTIFFTACP